MYDLIIKNGKIIDGTGKEAVYADIAVADGKIVKVCDNITEQGAEIIDAKGLTVTPGFIDSHSHSDDALFDYPDMIEKIEQGITTSVAGQCGISYAPVGKDINAENSPDIPGYGKEYDIFKTFGTMMENVKNIPLGSNIVMFVGHSALRKAVIGYENRKPTEQEMEEMKVLLRDAMENGALGLSYGLIYTPSCYAETDELIELAKVVKEYDGIISAHIRNEGFELVEAVEEFLTVIKTVNTRAVFSHHKSMYSPNWGKVNETLKMIQEAVAEGYDIYCDVYPYEATSTSLAATVIPKEMRALSNKEVAEFVSDVEMRNKIKMLYAEKNGNSLNNLLLAQCKSHSEYEGMRIDEIAKQRGQDDFDAAFDIIRDSEADAQICNFSVSEEDIGTVMKYERSMICTDASVAKNSKVYHPRLKGSFPRFLGRYVNDKKVVSMEEAIRKCTSLPAFVYRLSGKGIIREGFDADICIFNEERIKDKADYMNCTLRCEGLEYVIVGGENVVKNAIYNGKRKGKVIFAER